MKDHYIITYQKQNGEIFERKRTTLPNIKVGGISSMGWKVLDIKVYCQYRWYSLETQYAEYKAALRDSANSLYWDLKEWA